MAKLTRQAQQIFAGQAPSDMIAAFGSTQTGTPVYSTDLSTLQTANYQQGWQDAIIADKAPFLEEMNGVMYGTTYQLAYLMQQGMPEWDAGTTYYTNSRAMGSDGNIYKSVTDDNIGNNPTTDSGTNWVSDSGGTGLPVGTIFAHTANASFVPENSLPCDGTEYTQAQFPTFYNDWLVGARLNTCTYEEYQAEITATGECLKIALDTINQKFKVPTKINKILAVNKNIPIKGNGLTLGLTDSVYNYGLAGANSTSSAFVVQGDYGSEIGTSNNTASSGAGTVSSTSVGATLDSSKSGIETDATNTTFKDIRFFIVVATGAINQSEMDWSEWVSSLAGKANINADNFSAIGKAEITSWGIPNHNATTTLTLPSAGQIYTVPYDCYMYFCDTGSAGNGVVLLRLNSSSGAIVVQVATADNNSYSIQGITFAKGTKLYVQNDKNIAIKTICPLIGAEI